MAEQSHLHLNLSILCAIIKYYDTIKRMTVNAYKYTK